MSEAISDHCSRLPRVDAPVPDSPRAEGRSGRIQPRSTGRIIRDTLTRAGDTLRGLVVPFLPTHRWMIWIDGVGAWQLCSGRRFSVGAAGPDSAAADISLLANISRRHAVLEFEHDQWRLSAEHPATVSGRKVEQPVGLSRCAEICLADRVKLKFRVPSILSSSAVIDFESSHRPTRSVDGMILMVDHCLLGPRSDHHVPCPFWPDVVVLYDQEGQLRCRAPFPLKVSGRTVSESAALTHGTIVEGEELRFRIEQIR